MIWVVHPFRARDFSWHSRCPSSFALGSSDVYNPKHPSSRLCTDTIQVDISFCDTSVSTQPTLSSTINQNYHCQHTVKVLCVVPLPVNSRIVFDCDELPVPMLCSSIASWAGEYWRRWARSQEKIAAFSYGLAPPPMPSAYTHFTELCSSSR